MLHNKTENMTSRSIKSNSRTNSEVMIMKSGYLLFLNKWIFYKINQINRFILFLIIS